VKPTVAVLLGDAGGVGPEMALKLLARDANRQAAQVLLIGSADLLADAERITGLALDPLRCDDAQAVRFEPGRVSWLPTEGLGGPLVRGQATERRASRRCAAWTWPPMRRDRAACRHRVRAAEQAHALRMGGLQQEDELRHLQQRFAVTASSANSTSPAACGPRASRRTCRCATWPR
jgi:4-hydroxythreonine-4-phosphate dehydrogenase